MASFKEVAGLKKEKFEADEEKDISAASKAAAAILATHTVKSARVGFRISEEMLQQFTAINKKLGATNSSVLNTIVARYIMENKNLLNED
jgi:predicted DNA binding CopG/RHH family protein